MLAAPWSEPITVGEGGRAVAAADPRSRSVTVVWEGVPSGGQPRKDPLQQTIGMARRRLR